MVNSFAICLYHFKYKICSGFNSLISTQSYLFASNLNRNIDIKIRKAGRSNINYALFPLNQVELVQNLVNGVNTLIRMEKALENKETIDQLIKSAEAYIKNKKECENAKSSQRDEESFAEARNCEI